MKKRTLSLSEFAGVMATAGDEEQLQVALPKTIAAGAVSQHSFDDV
jgi:hypothetical protein